MASLGSYQVVVDAALAEMAANRIMERIWAHDYTVWKPEPTEITNRLGWLHSADAMREQVHRLEALAAAVHSAGYIHALLLGMGGSSLAPELFSKTFGTGRDDSAGRLYVDLSVLDSTDPGAVLAQAERLDPTHTLFIVSTKSGGTVETISLFRFFYNWIVSALSVERAGEHFIAITDPHSSLADLADRYHFRTTFLNDPNIGGRYSALSYFGLVPAALVGVDVRLLLEQALTAAAECGPEVETRDNPGAWLGAVLSELAKAGRDKVTFLVSSPIASFGDWVEQLIAESTGKEGQGILPVVGEPLGPPSVYGDDRLFVYLRLDDVAPPTLNGPLHARCRGTDDESHETALTALEAAGHPVVRLRLHNRYDLGRQFFLWEMATAVAGHRLAINPFDQPNVEATKVLARQMVAEYMARGTLPVEAPMLTSNGISVYGDVKADHLSEVLTAFLCQAEPSAPSTALQRRSGRSYVALQAYVPPNDETDAALLALRTQLRDKFQLATTVGYGPRFLHSTGQLHKGDAGRGFFIQFTADDLRDAPIPDEAGSPASSITFGVLKAAQALGDRQALLNAGRRVIRFHLGPDVVGGLKHLTNTLR